MAKLSGWQKVATVTSASLLIAAVAGTSIVSVIPKSIEFEDVKIVGARSERAPFGPYARTTNYEMVVKFSNGQTVAIPTSVDVSGRIGETVGVKIVENYFGGYHVYLNGYK